MSKYDVLCNGGKYEGTDPEKMYLIIQEQTEEITKLRQELNFKNLKIEMLEEEIRKLKQDPKNESVKEKVCYDDKWDEENGSSFNQNSLLGRIRESSVNSRFEDTSLSNKTIISNHSKITIKAVGDCETSSLNIKKQIELDIEGLDDREIENFVDNIKDHNDTEQSQTKDLKIVQENLNKRIQNVSLGKTEQVSLKKKKEFNKEIKENDVKGISSLNIKARKVFQRSR